MLRRSASGVDISASGYSRRSMRKSISQTVIGSSWATPLSQRRSPGSSPQLASFGSPDEKGEGLGLGAIRELPSYDTLQSSSPTAGTSSANRRNLALICLLAAIDGMDIQLLPASFKALEADLGLRPTDLALLAVCQGYAMCISGPLWGNIADQGFPRKILLAGGTAMWGLLTFLLATCTGFQMMLVLRTLNGVALGLITPVIQSYVAEISTKAEMGFSFGLIDFFHMAIGQTLALVIVAPLSGEEVFGIAGWRVAFIAVAIASVLAAIPVMLFLEERPREWKPESFGILSEFQKFKSYCQVPTFVVLVLQGMFGTIPGAAMAFTTMYFQYMGISGSLAGLVSAFKIVGTGLGAMLGGYLGDCLALKSPMHGRTITAQLSVALCIPIAAAVFCLVPLDESQWPVYAGLLFLLGLVHWAGPGCNRPVLVDLVAPDCIGSVVAWQNCVEHMSGFVLGPVGVALLSELMFDYVPAKTSVVFMPDIEKLANAKALGQGLAVCTALPWTVCFLLYGLLHVTYPRDVQHNRH